MNGLLSRVKRIGSPRSLGALSLMLSLVSAQGGRGTMAYFTSTVTSADLAFTAGTLDVSGSTLPTAALSWTTARGGTNCSTTLTVANDITDQRLTPGEFCVAPLTIKNDSSTAVASWLRMRLVRQTASDRASLAAPASLTVTSSTIGGSLLANTLYTYKVTATATDVAGAAVETLAATGSVTTAVAATSTATNTLTWPRVSRATGYKVYGRLAADLGTNTTVLIATITDGNLTTYVDTGAVTPASGGTPASAPTCAGITTTASCVAGPNDELNSRLRFYISEYTGGAAGASTTGDGQRSAARTTDCSTTTFKPNASTSAATIANGATAADANVTRTALTSVTAAGTHFGRSLAVSDFNAIPTSSVTTAVQQAFGIDGGVGSVAPFTEAAMLTTAGETRNAVNLVGDDLVGDPTSSVSNALSTGATGATEAGLTNTFGTDAPPNAAKAVRYYCMAIFFPSNSQLLGAAGQSDLNSSSGDNRAQAGSNTYSLVVTAAQKAGR